MDTNSKNENKLAVVDQNQQAIAKAEPAREPTVKDLILSRQDSFAQVLPSMLNPQTFVRVALAALTKTPGLAQCSRTSLISALASCAELGLMPNGALGQAYLLPFKGNVQLIVGYRGLIELARRSGLISSIQCFVVHEKDHFKYGVGVNGDILEHTPYDFMPGNSDGDPGKLVAAFCIARFKDGGSHITVMSRREIELVRRSSRSGDTGPWRSHYEEMAKKTVLRRASKMWPMQTEAMREMEKLAEIEACDTVDHQELKPALLEALADEVESDGREDER